MHTLPAPCDVDLGSRRRLQPDLLVLPFPDAATPVLVVEVLSRTGREYDQVGKRRAYQKAGPPSCWLLDPDGPSATVLELDGDGRYQEVARAVGEDECTLRRRFPVRFRPAALLR